MTFNDLKLSAPLLKAVSEAGYETPSPIQASAIPPVLEGRDLMGCAQTGTGKTAAFALPMLDRLSAAQPPQEGRYPRPHPHPHPGAGAPDRRELRRLRKVSQAAQHRHFRRRGPDPAGGGHPRRAWTSSSPARAG